MAIQDFHAALSSRNQDNLLFQALRQLRGLANVKNVLFLEEEAAAGGGWYPWMDNAQHRQANAEA